MGIKLAMVKKQLNSLNLKCQTKFMLQKTLIRPVLTNGSECWSPLKKDGNRFRIFGRNSKNDLWSC